jgi:hypothetical protein
VIALLVNPNNEMTEKYIRITQEAARAKGIQLPVRQAAVKLYQEIGFPALQKGGQDKKLVGYFQSDTGTINQLVPLVSG